MANRADATLVRAIELLGPSRVVTEGMSNSAWGVAGKQESKVNYSEKALHEAAQSNKFGTDFRLVYLQGYSLRQLYDKCGSDPEQQPCFYQGGWWLHRYHEHWAATPRKPGYRLIDFRGRFNRKIWREQERSIAELEVFERAQESSVAEAILTIYKVGHERLLEDWYHWGPSQDDISRVCIGMFNSLGLRVLRSNPLIEGSLLRVCLLRKPDRGNT